MQMTSDNKTNIYMIVDESGSMSIARNDTVQNINEYIQSQKGGAGKALFSLYFFDDRRDQPMVRKIIDAKDVDEEVTLVELESYRPYGSTPLYDALGRVMREIETEKPEGKILIVVITDGYENASREFTAQMLKDMIAEHKDEWQTVFIGSDIDTWEAAQKFSGNMLRGSTMSYDKSDPGSYKMMGEQLAMSTTRFRSASAAKVDDFFGEEDVSAHKES